MSLFNAYMALSGAVDADVTRDEPLSSRTTYRLGGPADLFVCAHSYAALTRTLSILNAEGVSWVILGKGSNVLASDEGYRGCVIILGREFSRIQLTDDKTMVAGAGVLLSKLVNEALKASLSGLECCAGIPGTLGGALWMNAGTRREWIGSCVRDVVALDPASGLKRFSRHEIDWGYRTTTLPAGHILLEATLEFEPGVKEDIASRMDALLRRRTRTQPTGFPTCGSVFKNPVGKSAGELIEKAGLKGYSVGGAHVSDVHSNFIVNDGRATSADVVKVISHLHDEVLAQSGIELMPEVRFLGF